MIKYYPFSCLILLLLLIGCNKANILIGERKTKHGYKIGVSPDCCGCSPHFFQFYEEGQLKEELIWERSCMMQVNPTVFVFQRNSQGIVSINQYLAVVDSSAEYYFNSKQKKVLLKLDSIVSRNESLKSDTLNFGNLIGYRKFKSTEKPHPYWIDQNNKTHLLP